MLRPVNKLFAANIDLSIANNPKFALDAFQLIGDLGAVSVIRFFMSPFLIRDHRPHSIHSLARSIRTVPWAMGKIFIMGLL